MKEETRIIPEKSEKVFICECCDKEFKTEKECLDHEKEKKVEQEKQKIPDTVKALEYMIDNELYDYVADSWAGYEHEGNYSSVANLPKRFMYRGEQYILVYCGGRSGRGGMDEGSGAVYNIIRIKGKLKKRKKSKDIKVSEDKDIRIHPDMDEDEW